MSYFHCKTIIRHEWTRSMSRISSTHISLFLQTPPSITTVRFISSSGKDPKKHSFAASYLIIKCGFSQESALLASKHLKFKTPDQPDSVIAMFKHYGLSQADIFKLVKKYPKVLLFKPKKTLSPKLEFFRSKGLLDTVCKTPEILCRSLEHAIIPAFSFLSDLLQSDDKTIIVAKRWMTILRRDTERDLKPCIKVLIDSGVPKSNIALLLRHWPRCIAARQIRMRKFVETVNEMGFDPSKVVFVEAVAVISGLSKSVWEKKVGIYKSWGWSEEEILAAFRKEPFCMMASEGRIMAVMDFLVNKMDCESSFIARNPTILLRSLKKTIIPRASVLQFLLSKKLINRKPSLVSLFLYSEKLFLQKFVYPFDEAPKLLQLYMEKPSLSQ